MTPSTKQAGIGIKIRWLLEITSKRGGRRRDMTPTIRYFFKQSSSAYEGYLQGRIRTPFPQTNSL
jgi:hypothetical protein